MQILPLLCLESALPMPELLELLFTPFMDPCEGKWQSNNKIMISIRYLGDSVLENFVIFILFSILQSKQTWNESLFQEYLQVLLFIKQYIQWLSWV